MLEDPCQKVIRVIKEKQQNRDYAYEEKTAILDFLVKSKFGEHYMGKVSALHRLVYHMQYEIYEKGKTIYTNMDQIDKHYIILNGRVAVLESKNIEQMNYSRQRDQQFDYDRTLSQLQVNQQARQLKKRCELQKYDSFGFHLQIAQKYPQQYSQTSDHIVLVMENTHVLIVKAKIIQENNSENQLLNCKFVGHQLQVEYTLLNDILCEQCFKKKGMYICQESQNPRFVYCVLYGSVLYQDQTPAGTTKNRVVLGEGAIIGQSLKNEKPSSPVKIQNQISQRALQKQNTKYYSIQLDVQDIEKSLNEQEEQVESQIYSSSDYTVVLMIDREKLNIKLSENRKQQEYQNQSRSNKQLQSQGSQRSVTKTNYSQVNNMNSNIQQSRKEQKPPQDINLDKKRLVFQKKNRSQSYSILCKLIQKEERSNSYSRNKQNFIELNSNYKKEYLGIEQPETKNRIQSQISQSYNNNANETQNSVQIKNQQVQNNQNNKNDFDDVVKRLAEKSVFPQYYQQHKKYNKLLMKNLKDREEVARLIIESKKPVHLQNYFSNPENYMNKDQLMSQFHSKYLQNSIKELQSYHKQKRSYTHQTQTDTLENFNINSIQTQEEIDKFIQKINRQLMLSEIQQALPQNNAVNNNQNISMKNNSTNVLYKQRTLGNITNEQNVDLNQDKEKFNHLTSQSQQLFYPYRVQEMLDQIISLKNLESGQKNFGSIEIRKSSNPLIKTKEQNYIDTQQQEDLFENQEGDLMNNDLDYQYQDIAFESNQELQEANVNYPSNDSFQNDQYLNQLNIQERNLNQNIEIDQNQNTENTNFITSNQTQRLGSLGNVCNNQTGFSLGIEKGVLRSQSLNNILRQQKEIKQQKLFALDQMYPNIKQRSLSRNKIQFKNNPNFTKSQNEAINKILTKTEFRLKRQSEHQLNKVLSEECRGNTIFKSDKNLVSIFSTYLQNTQYNSQKTSRRQSHLKARPSTSNSDTNQFNLTSKQMMLTQFNNNNNLNSFNQTNQQKNKSNQKTSDPEANKTPNRTILFSRSDRRYSKINLPQQKQHYEDNSEEQDLQKN